MLLEAMLAGLPVVATRVSAVPEIVADGETGLLVAAGDADARRRRAATAARRSGARAPALGEAGLRARARRVLRRAHGRADDRRLPRRPGRVREVRCASSSPARSPTPTGSRSSRSGSTGHNNPRYAELLPRLERLDACLLRPLRRADPARAPVPRLHRSARRCATRRSSRARSGGTDAAHADFEQLATWRGPS